MVERWMRTFCMISMMEQLMKNWNYKASLRHNWISLWGNFTCLVNVGNYPAQMECWWHFAFQMVKFDHMASVLGHKWASSCGQVSLTTLRTAVSVLPLNRFAMENIFLGAIWVDHSKSSMKFFLQPIVDELNRIQSEGKLNDYSFWNWY